MEGGRILGQGAYGCVFTPPLLCKKKDVVKDKVGKLTSEKDAYREYNAFLYNQYDKDINKCDFIKKIRNKQTKIKQLTMEYGGIDLESVKYINFFTLFSHLLVKLCCCFNRYK